MKRAMAAVASADGLPLIGEMNRWPGVHIALGYGGNGISFAVIAGQLIRDAVRGKAARHEGVLSIKRSAQHAGGNA